MAPKRVVRFKEETAGGVKSKRKVKKEARTVALILEELESSTAEKVSKSLTEEEILELVDFGLMSDEVAKYNAAIVKAVKSIVLPAAKAEGWKTKAGAVGAAKIGPSTSTVVVPTRMVKLLAKLKKQNLFNALFSVKIGEVKKYLGEDVLKQASKVETEPFGTVSFKRVKKLMKE